MGVVCPWVANPHGVVSLLDIMNYLRVGEVAELLDNLRQLVELQKKRRARLGGDTRLDSETMVEVGKISRTGADLFSEIEFENASKRIELFETGVITDSTIARFQSELENLIAAIIEELKARHFCFVSLDRVKLLEGFPFGDKVAKAFPSTEQDIDSAASCIGLELHLAAVFHLMRVAEGGLRCLAKDRGVVFAQDISLQAWEDVLRGLEDSEKKIQGYPKTLKREEQFQFYHGAMMELKRFKNVWRNRISHLRNQPVDRDEALSTFNHVKAFMQILATHISEGASPLPEIWV